MVYSLHRWPPKQSQISASLTGCLSNIKIYCHVFWKLIFWTYWLASWEKIYITIFSIHLSIFIQMLQNVKTKVRINSKAISDRQFLMMLSKYVYQNNILLTGRLHGFPFTFTHRLGGKWSSCGQLVSDKQNLKAKSFHHLSLLKWFKDHLFLAGIFFPELRKLDKSC